MPRATGGGGHAAFSIAAATPPAASPTPAATALPVATATPTPQPGETVVVRPVSGRILVKRPGSNEFVELDGTDGIPLGSTVDAKNGRVQLTIEPGEGKPAAAAVFYAGIFQLTQPGATSTSSSAKSSRRARSSGARAAQEKPKSRKLWGDGKGEFRTTGRYSAATVRGTKWLVQDTCDRHAHARQARASWPCATSGCKKTVLVRAGQALPGQTAPLRSLTIRTLPGTLSSG